MIITNAQYTDETGAAIKAEVNGIVMFIPVDEQNRHYKHILDNQINVN